MANSPILDLSYRHYDGPLEAPVQRWWAIAKMSMRLAIKKKGFWIWSALSGYWYVILITIFYFIDVLSQNTQAVEAFFAQIKWKDQFLNAFSISQLLLFIIALLIGIGSIANDNRANALLIYLSKPCSKVDYLIGKWLGIFIPIVIVTVVPTLLFFIYGMLSFRNYGFLSQDPLMIVRLLAMCLISGFFHASVCLGISSMSNQGRMAGAAYAGVYFVGLFFTKAMQIIHAVMWRPGEGRQAPGLVNSLYYMSIDGTQIGMAKLVLGTDGSMLINPNGPGRGPRNAFPPSIEAPSIFLIGFLYFGICALALMIAWRKVRAVEVVG